MRFPLAAIAILSLAGSVLLAGAASAEGPEQGGPAQSAKKRGAKLKLVKSEFGKAVMNGRGRVLYLFDKETDSTPQCYDECAVAWPPMLTKGKPVAGKGLNQKLLGTTLRTDGTRQVTYKGHPLYYYVHDRPGLILCQDVFEFGGNWLIVNRRGNAIR